MREIEMRRRIETVLRTPLQRVLIPVLGLGLAVGACGGGGSEYGAQFPHDGGGADQAARDGASTAHDTAIDSEGRIDGTSAADAPITIDGPNPTDGAGPG